MASKIKARGLFDPAILGPAAISALRKLDPRILARNPVIFVTEAVSAAVTGFFIRDLVVGNGVALFSGQIAAWLWFTVLFANFAEAVAEGRGKAQADFLRKTRSDARAKKLDERGTVVIVAASSLRKGDLLRIEAGELIPADGDVVKGAAT